MTKIIICGFAASVLFAANQAAAADNSATWQAQISNTADVQARAAGGAGVSIAVVDTGVVANHPEIAGRVSNVSSCAAVSFTCPTGFVDDNSHGTAVAAIAAGRYSATNYTYMSGVAPAATLIAEKVLPASGVGTSADVASGIVKAADAGARVINLSVSYLPDSNLVSAINYAAAKGAVMVWAGGNQATSFNGGANTSGLSTAALSHMIVVGGVTSTNSLWASSNTPGAGSAVAGSTSASYRSLWLVAPAQGIMAPYATNGMYSYSAWSGTSMAAPMASGAVALLEAAWPILYTKGTASEVLFRTATDLGASGVDATFGNGLLNLDLAFHPIGAMYVIGADGSQILVSSLTNAMIADGALGDFSTVSSQLTSYTAFDSFARNFVVDLTAMIGTTTTTSGSGTTTTTTTTTTKVKTGKTGGHMMLIADGDEAYATDVLRSAHEARGFGPLIGGPDHEVKFASFSDAAGNLAAFGKGVSSASAFSQAKWGPGSLAADADARIGASNALLSLAQGGVSAAFGTQLGAGVRLAAASSATDLTAGSGLATYRTRTFGRAAALSVSGRLSPHWSMAATLSTLSEHNGLLGSVYDGRGLLSLGARHRSRAVSIQMSRDLGGGRALMLDATSVRTDGAAVGYGLIRNVSALQARAYGISYVQSDAFRTGDRLMLSVRKPLRVVSGTADLAMTGVDVDGLPVTRFATVGLRPPGDQTDWSLGYVATTGAGATVNSALSLSNDARNTRGLTDIQGRIALNLVF